NSGAGFAETASARVDIQIDARLTLHDAVVDLSNALVSAPSRGKQVAGAHPYATWPAESDASRARPSVRLAEVAEVVYATEPPVGAALYDGRPAVYVQVSKLPWADT